MTDYQRAQTSLAARVRRLTPVAWLRAGIVLLAWNSASLAQSVFDPKTVTPAKK
jgi:hypothetical protein